MKSSFIQLSALVLSFTSFRPTYEIISLCISFNLTFIKPLTKKSQLDPNELANKTPNSNLPQMISINFSPDSP